MKEEMLYCSECERQSHPNVLKYDKVSFKLYCDDCTQYGIPYNEMNQYLQDNYPYIYNSLGKVTSARLDFDETIFIYKYAQEYGLKSVTEVIKQLIQEKRNELGKELEEVELKPKNNPFVRYGNTPKQAKNFGVKRKLLKVGDVPKEDKEVKEMIAEKQKIKHQKIENEDVFTI